jgi:hypothetical protein
MTFDMVLRDVYPMIGTTRGDNVKALFGSDAPRQPRLLR